MKREIWRNPYTPKDKSITHNNNLLPIVLRYNQFDNTIINLWKTIIKENDNFKDCRLVSAFSKNKSLADYLVRSKLKVIDTEHPNFNNYEQNPNSRDEPTGFNICGSKRCMTCTHHAISTEIFKSTYTREIFNIKDNISCGCRNVIYLITCRKCQLQYVGETGRELRERVVDHRSAIRTHKNTPIGIHFNEEGHSLLDLSVMAIEQSDNSLARKQREEYWQRKLHTKFPKEINSLH